MKIIRSFAVELEIWKTFLANCRREGGSGSKTLQDFIMQYNEKHKLPNPQLLIERFSGVTNHKTRQPSDCHFWKVRVKPTPPYQAYCSKYKRMVLGASCCDLWKA